MTAAPKAVITSYSIHYTKLYDQGRYDDAKATASWLAGIFGPERFWLEIQEHGIPDERVVTEGMLRLGKELGLGVVATNDAHYLTREHAEAHDVV